MELAGPVSSPAPPPPPVNARTLLTHAAGSGPAHWSADGYLSAVARTGPDVVWPLEEGGPPASCIGTGAQRFVATDASVADVGARQAPGGTQDLSPVVKPSRIMRDGSERLEEPNIVLLVLAPE